MYLKTVLVLCLLSYVTTTEAVPINSIDRPLMEKLEALGFRVQDMYDYNTFILSVESVIEQAQKGAIYAIEQSVTMAEELARLIKSLGDLQNTETINSIETLHFKRIEDMRHQAYLQKTDISNCSLMGVQLINEETRRTRRNISEELDNIRQTFDNYSHLNFINPANQNMNRTYSVRERIYECPFSFSDFLPYYVCLNAAAVLEDVQILNDFSSSVNKTIEAVGDLVYEYGRAALSFSTENIVLYINVTNDIFQNKIIPCAEDSGVHVVVENLDDSILTTANSRYIVPNLLKRTKF